MFNPDASRQAWVREKPMLTSPKKKKTVVDPADLLKSPFGFFACLTMDPNTTVVKKKRGGSNSPERMLPQQQEQQQQTQKMITDGMYDDGMGIKKGGRRRRRIVTEPPPTHPSRGNGHRRGRAIMEDEILYSDDEFDEQDYIADVPQPPPPPAPKSYVRSRSRPRTKSSSAGSSSNQRGGYHASMESMARQKRTTVVPKAAATAWDSATTALVF